MFFIAACGGEDSSPEAEVRRYLAKGEAAVEAGKVLDIKEMISPQYADESKRTRQDLMRVVAGYLMRHKNIHLFTRIDKLNVWGEDRARVVLYVAMTGSPIADTAQLLKVKADLHRFELDLGLGEGDEWRLLSAQWRRATPDDFLPIKPAP